ncbi:hypothetical protein AU210_013484 [Fusarium oxysporum f. sp. radicis-cucumerinum]|uniref:GRF-like zinc ribbon domain-containing protein n=1 Tax=Fusarium oxysporum f. sp. radicis-cucumerinum TaxID=327505 RepID=A0A2H3GQS7_FUSOX|nr:hypothetical protein AU210_013484 [Fusarium oxysporum f. sp. radicis-cucumerinum]
MEAYYPSQHTMAPQFPLIQPPNCPLCPNTPIRARVDPAKRSPTAGRPYYYCQADHKRQFLTWDDIRRNEGNGPVPSAWYNCSSRRCSFNQNIDVDDIDESPHSSPSSRQGSTGSSTIAGSTYGGNDRKMTAREENDSELLDKMNAMTVKIKKLETTIASRPSTTARPIDGDCCVHGNGRRSFFSRRRCICI